MMTSIEQGRQISELLRRVSNIVRMGKVVTVDYNKAKARVKIGEITTGYLPWLTPSTSAWIPLKMGEQVVVLSPNGDLRMGMILPALYQSSMPAPSTDDKKIVLNSDIEQTGEVKNNGNISCTGNMKADGNVEAIGDMKTSGNLTADGDINTSGELKATGEVTGKNVKLSTHTHKFAYNGGNVPSTAITQMPN